MRIDAPIFTGSFSLNGSTLGSLTSVATTGSNTFLGGQSATSFAGDQLTANDRAYLRRIDGIAGTTIEVIAPISASAGITGSTNFDTIVNKPTLVSGSSQVIDILSSLNSATASFTPRISNLESKSSSVDISISNINSVTASNIARLSNLETKSASVDISITNINSYTSSQDTKNTTLGSYTGSNDTKWTSIGNLTGSYATTGSNTFFGTQTYSGSVYIANDLIVQGSSSIQYISASSVSIGTNIVQLNTANPSVRYAGLSIIDSGSIGGSGSFLYDSVQDEFIFVHRGNGTNITSSHFVLGPETYDSLGNETYLTSNIIPKGTGKEHLIDSCIFDNGTTTCIKNNLIGTGTACFASSVCIGGDLKLDTGAADTQIILKNNASGNPRSIAYNVGDASISFNRTSGGAGATFFNSGVACFSSTVCAPSAVFSNAADQVIRVETTSATDNSRIDFITPSKCYTIQNLQTGAANSLIFYDLSASAERMRITNCGNVGIGTCNPDMNNWGAGHTILGLSTAVAGKSSQLNLRGNSNATGCVMIGTMSYLDSSGTGAGSTMADIAVYSATATSGRPGAYMVFKTNDGSSTAVPPTERMRITSCGNVGIGINPTSTFFQVSGNSPDNIAWFNNTQSNGYASARFYNNCNKAAVFGVGGSAVGAPYANNGYIYTDSGVDLAFAMGGVERMRITSTGVATFTCTIYAPNIQVTGQIARIDTIYLGGGLNGTGNATAACYQIESAYALASNRTSVFKGPTYAGSSYYVLMYAAQDVYVYYKLALIQSSYFCGYTRFVNSQDGSNRTGISQYSLDNGGTWTTLGTTTFGPGYGYAAGGVSTPSGNYTGVVVFRAALTSGSGGSLVGIDQLYFMSCGYGMHFINTLG